MSTMNTHVALGRPGAAVPDTSTWRAAFAEVVPILDAPAVYGPPIRFVLGPWLLLVLLLIGPLALIFTLVLVMAATLGLLAVLGAVIASPYLLIRHLHAHLIADAESRARLYLFHPHPVGTGRLDPPQPKGVS